MPCFNPGPFLEPAIASVLTQPECLELIVADGGSTDGSVERLRELARTDPRLRVVSEPDQGPADALNKAFCRARGTLIGWLNADDLYAPGALARAVAALAAHPEWLMVYGEGEEFDEHTGLRRPYPTLPPMVGLAGFGSHCFICQPSVVFRRAMAILLGPFNTELRTAFDFDYWLRAFASFPRRIGYLPHLQAFTRLHAHTITAGQRAEVALEATTLLGRYLGPSTGRRLHNYALELQLGRAALPPGQSLQQHLQQLVVEAGPWLQPRARRRLLNDWLLDPATAAKQVAAEQEAARQGWHRALPVQLLQALQPGLRLEAHCAPAGPHRRLQAAVHAEAERYPLLHAMSAQADALLPPDHASQVFLERPFGVNLIGHAFDVFGIGEDIRMAAAALQAAGVPCCVLDHPAGNGAERSDRRLEALVHADSTGGPYAFNLICLAAPIQARWHLQHGFACLRERYTCVAWPWETEQWPQPWEPVFAVADEFWPSSRFTARSLQPHSTPERPLHWMPMAAEIEEPQQLVEPAVRRATRALHGLPQEAVIFAYGFDFNSTASRKNPMGALEAFQRAFPPDQPDAAHPPVALMIKTFPPRRFQPAFHWLQERVAADPRIHLIVGSLERRELLRLYGACDVFLSLHRSEGFGRGLAEALQLGLEVIATDYGGNTDFCHGPLSHAVPYQLVPIPPGSYPCADSHQWAEPDLPKAAALLQEVARRRWQAHQTGGSAVPAGACEAYRDVFSLAAAGRRYRQRLEELWQQRQALAAGMRWRADRSPWPLAEGQGS